MHTAWKFVGKLVIRQKFGKIWKQRIIQNRLIVITGTNYYSLSVTGYILFPGTLSI